MDYTAYHPRHGQQLRSKTMTDKKVLSGDDLTNLIHSTVKAWAEEKAHMNSDPDADGYVPFLDGADDRYREMMKQLSEECLENRHNYHRKGQFDD